MGKFIPGFKDSERLRMVLAIVISLIAIMPSITGKGPDPVKFLFNVIPAFSMFILIVLILILFMTLAKPDSDLAWIKWTGIVGIVIYGVTQAVYPDSGLFSNDLLKILLGLGTFWVIGGYIFKT